MANDYSKFASELQSQLTDLAAAAGAGFDRMDEEHDKSEYDSMTDDLGNTRFAFGDIANFAQRVAGMLDNISSIDGAVEGVQTLGEKVDKLLGIADGVGYGNEADEVGSIYEACAGIASDLQQAYDADQPETVSKKISPEMQRAIEETATAALYVKERAEVLVDAVRPGANSIGDEALVDVYRAADSVRSAAGNVEGAVESGSSGQDVTRAIDNLQSAVEALVGIDYSGRDDMGQQIPSLTDEIVDGVEELYAAGDRYAAAFEQEPDSSEE